jgi:hypothetical protein
LILISIAIATVVLIGMIIIIINVIIFNIITSSENPSRVTMTLTHPCLDFIFHRLSSLSFHSHFIIIYHRSQTNAIETVCVTDRVTVNEMITVMMKPAIKVSLHYRYNIIIIITTIIIITSLKLTIFSNTPIIIVISVTKDDNGLQKY